MGIGLAAADHCVRHGAKVVVSSEQTERQALKEVRKVPNAELCNLEIKRLQRLLRSGKAIYIKADKGKDKEIERLVRASWKSVGTVSVLINNVGIYNEPQFFDITREDFDRVLGINTWSHLKACQEFAQRRIGENQGGRILCTTSINAERSEPDHTLYDMSKAALNGLIRQMAIELAPQGFTTMGIAAGLHATKITDFGLVSDSAARQAINEQIPLGIGTADDVGAWIAFAASDSASYSTGTIVNVDGGLTPQQIPVRPISQNENR